MNISKCVILIAILATLVVAGLFSPATSQPPPAARRTIFSTLKIGQSVALRDKGGLFEIGTIDDTTPLSHKVAEIGEDFIVLRDDASVIETRIPVTAIRAITHLKTQAEMMRSASSAVPIPWRVSSG